MESLLQLNDYESIADEWAIIEQVETTCYHTLDIAHLTYLYYLPQVLHYYQVQVCINIVSNICGIVGIRQRRVRFINVNIKLDVTIKVATFNIVSI